MLQPNDSMNIMDQVDREMKAENEFLRYAFLMVLTPEVDPLSVHKVAARFSRFSKGKNYLMMADINAITDEFYTYWLDKEPEYLNLYDEPDVLEAIRAYIGKVIWTNKIKKRFIADRSATSLVFISMSLEKSRKNTYEAFTKLVRNYSPDNEKDKQNFKNSVFGVLDEYYDRMMVTFKGELARLAIVSNVKAITD